MEVNENLIYWLRKEEHCSKGTWSWKLMTGMPCLMSLVVSCVTGMVYFAQVSSLSFITITLSSLFFAHSWARRQNWFFVSSLLFITITLSPFPLLIYELESKTDSLPHLFLLLRLLHVFLCSFMDQKTKLWFLVSSLPSVTITLSSLSLFMAQKTKLWL